MRSEKVNFTNAKGETLTAELELPVNQHPHTYVLFAHCFKCNKNMTAIRNISRPLTIAGFAVLRFDFTGLGEQEGDLANNNFASSIQDLEQAAHFLADNYQPAGLLIGHSLGGTAVIRLAAHLESVKAVVTIGTPFDPEHIRHLLENSIEKIEAEGADKVHIGGRKFAITKQFLEDIRDDKCIDRIKSLRKALLIMHSPQDRVVAIENAAKIYRAAMHPKSFISLDGADHLLSQKSDSLFAGDMIAAWAKKYVDQPKKEKLQVIKEVAVRLGAEGYTTDVMVRHHGLTADEPESVGGNDFGPSPYELVSAGLGACTAMTLHMYARRKKWDLQEVVVHLEHYKDYATDMQNVEEGKSKIDHFSRLIEVRGELDEKQQQRLLEIANKCPVHRTLHNPVEVKSELKKD
jgi:putative redox protein